MYKSIYHILNRLFQVAIFSLLKDMLEEGSFQLPKWPFRPFQMSSAIINPCFLTGPVADFLASFIISNASDCFRILQKSIRLSFQRMNPFKGCLSSSTEWLSFVSSVNFFSLCLSPLLPDVYSFHIIEVFTFCSILVLCPPLSLATLSSLDLQNEWGSAL